MDQQSLLLLEVLKGPSASPHAHTPNQEITQAEHLAHNQVDHARTHPELNPAQIIRNELLTLLCSYENERT